MSICHYTSELYKRLEGTVSMAEAFHCTVAPVQACKASAQRAWRLGTAAMSSPGLTTGQSFAVTLQWPLLQGNWEQVLLHLCLEELNRVTRTSFIPTPTPAHSGGSVMARQGILKGPYRTFLPNLRASEGLAALAGY